MKIDGFHLKRAVGETANLLKAEKNTLNDINVYPVADGDTGTNLYITLQGVWDSVKELEDRRASIVAQRIAEASLYSAKGNSGVIMSQFFWGFREGVDGKESLGVKDLAVAFSTGAKYAYQAVSNPVEGTILTVMRETAQWASRFVSRFRHTGTFLKHLFEVGARSLERTPELLARLGKPRVVDSGAYGYLLFLEGLLRSVGLNVPGKRIRGQRVERERSTSKLYCSNFLVQGGDADLLRAIASSYGDSVIVIGRDGLFKVHVHTSDPDGVEWSLSKIGKVIQQKVEPIW